MDVSAYVDAIWLLLPPGPAWSRDDPVLACWVESAARRLAAIDAALHILLREADPSSAQAMLPDWEVSLGLPVGVDDVTGRALPVSERQQRVVQKLLDQRGQRLTRYYALAMALGYLPGVLERSVTRKPARAGRVRAGQVLGSTSVALPPAGQVEFRRLSPLVSGFEAGAECAPPEARFGFEVRYTQLPHGESGAISPDELIQKIQRIAHAQSMPIFRSMYAPH